MTKVRKANYVFVTWTGDHSPRHVHVYLEGKLVLKWDLENGAAMKGKPTRRVLDLIQVLEAAGKV